jgi:hypothetical protein
MHKRKMPTTKIIDYKIIFDMYQTSLYESKPLSYIMNKNEMN